MSENLFSHPKGIYSAIFLVPLLYPIIWSVVLLLLAGWFRKETPETSQLLAHAVE